MKKQLSENPKLTVLTSILPFGKSSNGNYRFSLCIDLQYSEGGMPNLAWLQDFFLNYGSSIYPQILGCFKKVTLSEYVPATGPNIANLVNAVPGTRTAADKPIPSIDVDFIKPLPFPNFSAEMVAKCWGDLKWTNASKITSEKAESAINNFRNNTVAVPQNVTHFTPAEVDAEQLYKLGILAASGKGNEGLQQKAQKALNSLEGAVDHVKNNLIGIADFAGETNTRQFRPTMVKAFGEKGLTKAALDSKKKEAPPTDVMAETIYDIFSIISGNILLQRFFGLTIDFEIEASRIDNGSFKNEFNIILKPDEFPPDFKNEWDSKIDWHHFITSMKVMRASGKSVILVRQTETPLPPIAKNFDIGAKLKHLDEVKDRFKDICEILHSPTVPETEKIQKRREFMRIDSAALTRGVNLYDPAAAESVRYCLYQKNEAAQLTAPPDGASAAEPRKLTPLDIKALTHENVTRGNRYASESGRNGIVPLGSRLVSVVDRTRGAHQIDIPLEFQKQNFSVGSDAGMHALIETTDKDNKKILEHQLLVDTAILTWSGENLGMPGIFSNQEDETNFEATLDEGSSSISHQYALDRFQSFFAEKYLQKGVSFRDTRGPQALAQEDPKEIEDGKKLTIQYSTDKNAKLILGQNHKISFVPEYKNGWGPKFESDDLGELGFLDFDLEYRKARTVNFLFRRNEPVRPVTFYLQEPLLTMASENVKDQKILKTAPVPMRQGESLYHLVIRNEARSKTGFFTTLQKSVRYILPPPISFEHALWHNKLFNNSDGMSVRESYKWYLKYHFPEVGDEEDDNRGSTRMRPSYPADLFPTGCEINYLPDPLSKGFRFQFYKNENCTVKAKEYEEFEQFEFYFSGNYPAIKPWKLTLQDTDREKMVTFDPARREINIRVEKGEEIFAVARTILHESYEKQMETYGNYNSYTRYGNNEVLTPPLKFALIHATQRPQVIPAFNNLLRSEKELGQTKVFFTATMNVEQLGIYKDNKGIARYVEKSLPTGKIELYAKWKDYKDDPKRPGSSKWTPLDPINNVDLDNLDNDDDESAAVFETEINISAQLSEMEKTLNRIDNPPPESRNYAVDVTADYDMRETRYIEKSFWIKNKTKYASYFPDEWGIEDDSGGDRPEEKGYFNRVSKKPFEIKFLNSKKPDPPVLADRNITLVAVTEDLEDGTKRTASMNRLRFYFKRGRLSSGNGERIGFVLDEPESKYNDYFIEHGFVSMTGRDLVTDSARPYDGLYQNEQVLLTKANFVINDPYDLRNERGKPTADLESFSPMYVPDLGIMTYLPRFDISLDLWYLDVELDINDNIGQELHSPFLQFALVHYQENSFNYNKVGEKPGLIADCRLSDVCKSGFVYVLGSRTISCKWSGNEVKVGIEFDTASLADTTKTTLDDLKDIANKTPSIQKTVKSRFFAFIQWKATADIKWVDASRTLPVGEKFEFGELTEVNKYNLTLNAKLFTDTNYRVVIIELEERLDRGSEEPLFNKAADLLEDQNCRIVLVNTFNKQD